MNGKFRIRQVLPAMLLSAALIVVLDLLTNSLDISKYSWDFRYYIAMARDGFNTTYLASPLAYRYLTPLLVYGLTHAFGISIESGFRWMAYLGAFAQLTGVFLFTAWFTRSVKGAYIALLITAFSLFNVKFLLFDVYRPDHLAYALILLQTYLAFERKFIPLLVTTLIASQVREFNLIPLIAYLFSFAPQKDRPVFLREGLISAISLTLMIGLPRLLIPVRENFQFVELSRNGLLMVVVAPFLPERDLIFLYSLAAYLLPLLVLAGPSQIGRTFASLNSEVKSFLVVYIALVLILSFYGGTDFSRFSTYLFLPQAILLGLISRTASNLKLALTAFATFLFNRIWLPFPMQDVGKYLDFYGGFALRFNADNLWRMLECLAFILSGFIIRRFLPEAGASRPAG